MSNHLHRRSVPSGRVVHAHATCSKATSRAREIMSKDPVAARALLDIAAAIRESARARSDVGRACQALVRINRCLRSPEVDGELRAEMENARSALRMCLARGGRITKH